MSKALSLVFRFTSAEEVQNTVNGLRELADRIEANPEGMTEPGHYRVEDVRGTKVGWSTVVEL